MFSTYRRAGPWSREDTSDTHSRTEAALGALEIGKMEAISGEEDAEDW